MTRPSRVSFLASVVAAALLAAACSSSSSTRREDVSRRPTSPQPSLVRIHPGGQDLFVHQTALTDGARSLPDGATVEFEAEDGAKGPKAVNVKLRTADVEAS